MTRPHRLFCLLISAFCLLSFSGCGGHSNPVTNATPAANVSMVVLPSNISASDLTFTSGVLDEKTVNDDGTFSVKLNTDTVQLITAKSKSGNPVLFAIASSDSTTPVTLSTQSTAEALVLMNPLLATSDKTKSTQIKQIVSSLQEVKDLASLLDTQLKASQDSLANMNDELKAAIAKAADAVLVKLNEQAAKEKVTLSPDETKSGISITVTKKDADTTTVSFTHKLRRYAQVFIEDKNTGLSKDVLLVSSNDTFNILGKTTESVDILTKDITANTTIKAYGPGFTRLDALTTDGNTSRAVKSAVATALFDNGLPTLSMISGLPNDICLAAYGKSLFDALLANTTFTDAVTKKVQNNDVKGIINDTTLETLTRSLKNQDSLLTTSLNSCGSKVIKEVLLDLGTYLSPVMQNIKRTWDSTSSTVDSLSKLTDYASSGWYETWSLQNIPEGPTLSSITLTCAATTVNAGATTTCTATGTYSDNSVKDLTATATWTSSDTSKGTIAAGGTFTGVADGTTQITASQDGKTSNAVTLTVTSVPTLSSIAVTCAATTVNVNATTTCTATGTYSDNSAKDITATATWTSSDTSKGTIAAGGTFTGVHGGTTQITASQEGKTSNAVTVTVQKLNQNPVITAGPSVFFGDEDSEGASCGPKTVTVTASDPDGDTLSYAWSVTSGTISGTGASVTFTPPSMRSTYTISVTVTDSAGGSVTGSVDDNTNANTMQKISAATDFTCALLSSGGVSCWGSSNFGQLGGQSLKSGVSAISARVYSVCALLSTGGVKCWGNNFSGQLGDGTTTESETPVDVSGLTSGVSAISMGGYNACALLSTGGVKCWGANSNGQLGDGTTTQRKTPVDVSGLTSGISMVGAGATHTCALLSTGGVKCWGDNSKGQLGDGSTTGSSTPVTVPGITTAAAVAAGFAYTCALLSDGSVKCWGSNSNGQLGNGTTTDSSTPVSVSGITTATAITVGDIHTCALLAAGGVKCWGANGIGGGDGRLGDGTETDRATPVDVIGLTSGVSAISAGFAHTCAVLSDGTAKCWGRNTSSGLGVGGIQKSSTPVSVDCGLYVMSPWWQRVKTVFYAFADNVKRAVFNFWN